MAASQDNQLHHHHPLALAATFGTTTSRYISSLPHTHTLDRVLDTSIGACVVRWDLDKKKRLRWFQAHSDVISVMIKSPVAPYIIATLGHDGEVRFWEESIWNKLADVRVRKGDLMHGSWSADGKFLVVGSEAQGGLLSILRVSDGGSTVQLEREIEGLYWYPEFTPSGKIVAVTQKHETANTPTPTHANTASQSPNASAASPVFVVQLDPSTGAILQQLQLDPAFGSFVHVVGSNRDACAITKSHFPPVLAFVRRRHVDMVNMETFELLTSIEVKGSGIMKCITVEADGSLLCPSENGKCIFMESPSAAQHELRGPSGALYYCGWATPPGTPLAARDAMWVVNESGIHWCPVAIATTPPVGNRAVAQDVTFHQMVCCGLDFHPDGRYVACGDFGGQVLVWPLHDADNAEPYRSTWVPGAVRALCWHPNGKTIHIGTMGGEVYSWIFDSVNAQPQLMFALEDAVTCLAWENATNPRMLATGTTGGTLAVVVVDSEAEGRVRLKMAMKAHRPSRSAFDERFGSLTKYAEIWSLAWSPDNTRIATASEDQTVAIWNLAGERLHVLHGHTTAVTSVDWQVMSIGDNGEIAEILATCADDRTVRVWNASAGWTLYHVFDTTEVDEWHTVTYLALEREDPRHPGKPGHRIVCTTQNGYVFVWSLHSEIEGGKKGPKKLLRKRTHTGSVEGVRWHRHTGRIASCGSDCIVNVYHSPLLH